MKMFCTVDVSMSVAKFSVGWHIGMYGISACLQVCAFGYACVCVRACPFVSNLYIVYESNIIRKNLFINLDLQKHELCRQVHEVR
jgi:hypothetical protein